MANREDDSDSDAEIEDGVAGLTIDNDGDDMLSINSAMFHRDDWIYIESEKGNVDLFMKLAEYGQKIDEEEAVHKKVLSEEDYLFMRTTMMEKIGSWSTKYLPATVPAAAAPAAKGASAKKGGGGKKNAGPSKSELIIRQNTQKLLTGDVDNMRITADVGASEIAKLHQPASLLLYLVYWSLHVLHALKGKLKMDNKAMNVSSRVAMDCYMSLYRAAREMSDVVPPKLLEDVQMMDEQLQKYISSKISADLLGTLVMNHPELITDTHFDVVKPKNVALYAEQQTVLKMLNSSMASNKPLLIGYQVPPSGGKTILSVAVAAMLSHKFRTKRVLYICYNTLVRKAVANACAQAALPFWVASTRQVASGEASAIRPSNACLNMSRRAKRERWMAAQSSGFKNKEGEMDVMFAKAESQTVHHCPIIIADLASSIKLLQLFPDDFVAYVDEPTAGAERGLDNNKITELVAKICSLLPAQSVLLSATLPDIPTELPSLAEHFLRKHGGANNANGAAVQMVSSLRLPVGCDALDPSGRMVLPHQLADSFEQFKMVVSRMHGDALMQRFYTPSSVKGLAVAVEAKMGRDAIPKELLFENVIPHIGAVRHATIRTYGQNLLEFVAASDREDVFQHLKELSMATTSAPPVPCDPANLLSHHCADGRALAVATTRTVVSEDAVEKYESLDTLVKLAMQPFAPRMPKLKVFIADYKRRLEKWTADGASLANSKVSKRDKDAAGQLQDQMIAHEQSRPSFDWPIKVHGRGGGLPFSELETMADEVASLLLSGVGYYDPHSMTYNETVSVVKEATEGRLACLFASPFIVYGTNIDLTTVFIGSSYSRGATRNALYQLIGRAGRTGKSHRAKVLFQDYEALKKAMIPSVENTEAVIIEHHFRKAMGAQ